MISVFVSITNLAIASKNEDRHNFSAIQDKWNHSFRVRGPVPFMYERRERESWFCTFYECIGGKRCTAPLHLSLTIQWGGWSSWLSSGLYRLKRLLRKRTSLLHFPYAWFLKVPLLFPFSWIEKKFLGSLGDSSPVLSMYTSKE